MAITVDSSQWTGEQGAEAPAVAVVWGEFPDEAARDAAEAMLRQSGAENEVGASGAATPEPPASNRQVAPPDENSEDADRRNQRQLGIGTAMAATSMAAAGLVIASGGALLPAVAAAAAAGAGTGAIGSAVATAAAPEEAAAPVAPPVATGPVIGLRLPDPSKRADAEALLRRVGASRVFIQESAAD